MRPDVKVLMTIDSCDLFLGTSDSDQEIAPLTEDFWFMGKSLFLQSTDFPYEDFEEMKNRDANMEPEDLIIEESKIVPSSKKESKYASQPLRSDKEVNFRTWDVNLRDKLNLNKYTKKLHMGKNLLKHKMNEHKETFLPKPYTPFKFSSQQMHKIIKPEEPEKIMKEINLDQSFEIDYAELLTKYEFPAVLRLKKKFYHWLSKFMHTKIQQKKKELEEKKLQREEEERLRRMREEEEADMKARKDVVKVEPIVPKVKAETLSVHDIDVLDPLEDNPAKIIQ